ncbi:MAG: CYTH domain-containing protein [Gemmatimonadota bacterium]
MAAEFELKARLADGGDALRRRLREAGWSLTFRGRILDRRYDTPDRRLEARDEALRIRRCLPEDGESRAVLAWKGPASEVGGLKRRDEVETRVEDPAALAAILDALGYTEVTATIDRRIETWEKDAVSVRIERYPRMDTLAELEGPPDQVRARIGELGLGEDAWKSWPLRVFVERFEARTGREALLAEGDGTRDP